MSYGMDSDKLKNQVLELSRASDADLPVKRGDLIAILQNIAVLLDHRVNDLPSLQGSVRKVVSDIFQANQKINALQGLYEAQDKHIRELEQRIGAEIAYRDQDAIEREKAKLIDRINSGEFKNLSGTESNIGRTATVFLNAEEWNKLDILGNVSGFNRGQMLSYAIRKALPLMAQTMKAKEGSE